jgi:hypothetical protein
MPLSIPTQYMGLPNPVPGSDPGPQYALDIQSCMTIIDQHNHTPGSGQQITPAAIDINADLPFGSNNATSLRSVRWTPQSAPLSLSTDLGCCYVAGVDLYYNDVDGNEIRLTQGGSVVGSPGTITGLPSGTAGASYSAGTFVFQSATNTPANIDGGSFILRNNTANSFGLTLEPPSALAANYSVTLPSLPSSMMGQSFLTIDTSGNIVAYRSTNQGLYGTQNLAPGSVDDTLLGSGAALGNIGLLGIPAGYYGPGSIMPGDIASGTYAGPLPPAYNSYVSGTTSSLTAGSGQLLVGFVVATSGVAVLVTAGGTANVNQNVCLASGWLPFVVLQGTTVSFSIYSGSGNYTVLYTGLLNNS